MSHLAEVASRPVDHKLVLENDVALPAIHMLVATKETANA